MADLKELFRSSMVAGLACAATLTIAGPASATPMMTYQPPSGIELTTTHVKKVHSRRSERRARRYDRRRHGKRYRYRHGRYNHRHNGWWYAVPWWLGATLTLPFTSQQYSNRSAHVTWCDRRYRSYNPRTDQFLGYDGDYHYCNSPYDNR